MSRHRTTYNRVKDSPSRFITPVFPYVVVAKDKQGELCMVVMHRTNGQSFYCCYKAERAAELVLPKIKVDVPGAFVYTGAR